MEVDPPLSRIEADGTTGDEFEMAPDRWRMTLRRHVAEVLERAMRDPERPTLPTELLLERRLDAQHDSNLQPTDQK